MSLSKMMSWQKGMFGRRIINICFSAVRAFPLYLECGGCLTAKRAIYFEQLLLLFFKYSCLYCLSTTSPTPAIPIFHPSSYLPLILSMCPLYIFLKTHPLFPPISPPTSPLVTVSLFFISLTLVIFCLLVCFVD